MTTRNQFEQLRTDLIGRLRHAELLATHAPTREVIATVRSLRSQLSRLNDVYNAWSHGKVSVTKSWQPSDSFFITAEERDARKSLSTDRRVHYLN